MEIGKRIVYIGRLLRRLVSSTGQYFSPQGWGLNKREGQLAPKRKKEKKTPRLSTSMAFVCNLLIRLRIIDGIYSTLSYSIHELIRARPLAAIVNYKAVSKSITLTGYSRKDIRVMGVRSTPAGFSISQNADTMDQKQYGASQNAAHMQNIHSNLNFRFGISFAKMYNWSIIFVGTQV